jgi:Ca2+-binding EF-hand superfamily protein/uncharacterized protein YkwD
MSIYEKVIEEINQCRTNPSKYSTKLSNIIKYYRGNVFEKPGGVPLETEEGVSNVKACINYLKSVIPVPPLDLSDSLTLAAQMHADDIGPTGTTGHIGSDGSEPSDRIEKFCEWSGHLGENIDYGNSDPQDIVTSLLIDDGVLARGQRLNIMKKEHNYIGIGFGYHTEYQYVCVILFTELVIEDTSSFQSSSKSSARKMKKSEYIKVKEITPEQSKLISSRSKGLKARQNKINASETKSAFTKFDNTESSRQEILEIKKFFDKADHDSSGTVSCTEIMKIIENSDLEVSNLSAYQQIKDIDSNTIGTLDFEGFLGVVADKIGKKKTIEDYSLIKVDESSVLEKSPQAPRLFNNHSESDMFNLLIAEAKQLFNDLDTKKSGCIDLKTIKNALDSNYFKSYNSTIVEAINNIITTKPQKLDYKEFIQVLSNTYELSNSLQSSFRSINYSAIPKSKITSYESYSAKPANSKNPKKQEISKEKSKVSDGQISEIKKAFDLFDVKEIGIIKTLDLKKAMKDQGFKHKNPTVYKLISELVRQGKEELDYDMFYNLLTENSVENDSEDEIKKFFDLFDREKLGYIELRNLKKVAKELGENLDDDDMINLIRQSDLDGDGKVTYQDFFKIMSKVV